MKRRDFLKNTALASGAWMLPSFLKPFEAMASGDASAYRNLVVIQLSGGNDGLNTIVPFGNDLYYKKRSSIAIKPTEILKLSDMQGLNPNMSALREIYDQGLMTIINDVGYPNPDRSHFRSMDIWQTASDSNANLTTGWIGRYL
ncbi:MAG: twin-arginine translocation pathway signal, partial [Mucilaginibacter polytrichastri]|nr:twin-arginine translocation pathway signal [Mucilaginibacter polytrichastri]